MYIMEFLLVGMCPIETEEQNASCEANGDQCDYDSECPGALEKCCIKAGCTHRECIDMNRVSLISRNCS